MSRINIIALIAFVGVLVWVFLFGQGTVQRVQQGAMSVFGPIIGSADKVEEIVGEPSALDLMSKGEIRAQMEVLERENQKMKLEILKLDEIASENNALRRALNYVQNSPLELVPARVVSRKGATWYNTLIIDKGEDANIRLDSPVIIPVGEDAGLVGKVSQVGRNTAVILLLADEMCMVSSRILGTTEQGILSGQRGALRSMPSLNLKYLSKDAVIASGKTVISSGAGGVFPPNLLLGTITDFKQGPINGEASVKPAVNFDVLENVFVVLGERQEPEEDA